MNRKLYPHFPAHKATYQRGATLIELMVGITIGLLTIAVAIGALMVSRGVSGTVSEASQMQQQAAYAFRVIGQQLRQAGSVQLRLTTNTDPAAVPTVNEAVVFEKPKVDTVTGKDSPAANEYALTVGYQNYKELTVKTPAGESLFRDCLGQQPSSTEIKNQFILKDKELRCAGSNDTSQAIIQNVDGFQVRYLVQTEALTGKPAIQAVNAATILAMTPIPPAPASNWSRVFGVEVCLDLVGTENINTANASYTKCDGTSADRGNRLHMVFRNVYQLRSQGLTG